MSCPLETDFPDNLLKAIVGIEIPIARIEGKFKMSQNRSLDDHQTVAAIMRANVEQHPAT